MIPESDAAIYVNGKKSPAGSAKVHAGSAFVASYRDGRHSYELVAVPEGGEAVAQLRELESDGNTDWTTFQGNAARTGFSAARDRQTLELVWHKSLGFEIESSLIAVANTAFFSSDDHLINGIDLTSGELLWSEGSMGAAVTPIANSTHVFAGSDSGRFGRLSHERRQTPRRPFHRQLSHQHGPGLGGCVSWLPTVPAGPTPSKPKKVLPVNCL